MKYKSSPIQRDFLLSLFPNKEEEYFEFSINGFVLVRHYDSNFKRWTVNVYTDESFKKYKDFNNTEAKRQNEHIKGIISGWKKMEL